MLSYTRARTKRAPPTLNLDDQYQVGGTSFPVDVHAILKDDEGLYNVLKQSQHWWLSRVSSLKSNGDRLANGVHTAAISCTNFSTEHFWNTWQVLYFVVAVVQQLIVVLLKFTPTVGLCYNFFYKCSTCYTRGVTSRAVTGTRTVYYTDNYEASCGFLGWRRCRRYRYISHH
jgi:hypothetical protein